jgi:hypothetical protein
VLKSIVKSNSFAVPQYGDSIATQGLLSLQVRRATGTAALIGLMLAAAIMGSIAIWNVSDPRPVLGTEACSVAKDAYADKMHKVHKMRPTQAGLDQQCRSE